MANLTMTQLVMEEMAERARTGEPDPGVFVCGRCGQSDGVQMLTTFAAGPATRRERAEEMGFAGDFVGHLICPCCSHASCVHRTRSNCSRCGLPTDDWSVVQCRGHVTVEVP